jgi:hypothetical protein
MIKVDELSALKDNGIVRYEKIFKGSYYTLGEELK